jgi:hypothetical protein
MTIRTQAPVQTSAVVTTTIPGLGTPAIRRGLVAAGLAGVAAIHLADLPGKMAEVPYLGWAYLGLIVASLVLAELVTMRGDRRLMAASAGLAAAVILGFVVNRTVGMPNATDDIGNWGEPLGMVSLLVEGMVVWQGLRAWFARD